MHYFKLLLLSLLSVVTTNAFAATKNDTIQADASVVSKWIEHPTVNSKGAKTIKYFAIYKGELLTTNKTTVEKVELCEKYNVNCKLLLIGKKINGTFKPKRITVDLSLVLRCGTISNCSHTLILQIILIGIRAYLYVNCEFESHYRHKNIEVICFLKFLKINVYQKQKKQMKKFIISLIMATVAILTTTSCHRITGDDNVDQSWFTTEDSIEIARIAQSAVVQKNIVFNDANQVLDHLYYLSLTEEVRQMDPNVVVLICSILRDTGKDITMYNIVQEYDMHHEVFNSLPPDKLSNLTTENITSDQDNVVSVDSAELLDHRAENLNNIINKTSTATKTTK